MQNTLMRRLGLAERTWFLLALIFSALIGNFFERGQIALLLYLFPEARPSFYDWTVESCHGYAIYFEDGKPVRFEEV